MRSWTGLAWLLFASTSAVAAVPIDNRVVSAKTAEYAINASYPHTGIAAIDQPIKAWLDAEIAAIKNEAAPHPDSAAGAWTLDIEFHVDRNDDKVLALLFSESSYTGGAHGGFNFRSFNFLLPDGATLDLTQVLEGQRGLEKLSQLAVADLTRQLGTTEAPADTRWIGEGAGPDWRNFQHFELLPDALVVAFDPYQVASWADGPQRVSVPLATLADVLRKDQRAVQASFDCGKAATAVETAICADAPLAALDRELAAAYAQRIQFTTTPADKQIERSAQRSWLKQRDAACHDRTGTALVHCLTGVYRMRLATFRPTDG